jgi:tetratricopeptide (TPR) repeat protein
MGFLANVFEVLDFDPSVQKARKLEWDGDLDGAIRSLRESIQSKGASPMRFDKLGWLYVQKGDPQEALTYCDQAVAVSKGKTKYQATRARALRRLGRFDEALPLMQAQFQKNRMDIFNSSELCQLLVDMGRTAEAVPIFQDMQKRFGAEAGSPLANKIGMTAAYEAAKGRLSEAGVI